MKKFAFIFPGQGSQCVGMAQDLYNEFNSAKEIFQKIDNILGKNISELCFNGPEDKLKQTINTQPAILAVSIVCYELLKEKANIVPAFVAGHSLGEYSALYSAGVLNLYDTVKLVQKRAELMQSAQSGNMSAILGLADDKLEQLILDASDYGIISVANYNTPDQTVITGESKAIDFANNKASELGAKRVVPLAVSGAFHSELMKSAAEEFAKNLSNVKFNDAQIPVITNIDAKITEKKNEFESKMEAQIYSSVHWKQTIALMIESGVTDFIEIGPGKVLTGMVKKISRTANVYNINNVQSLNDVVLQLTELV